MVVRNADKKLKVTFVTSDIRIHTGGPVCLLNYIKNMPDNIDVSVIEFGNPHVNLSLDPVYSKILTDKVSTQFVVVEPSVISWSRNNFISRLIRVLSLNFIYPVYFKIKYRNLVREVSKSDIVYFINNLFTPFFNLRTTISIVTGHSLSFEGQLKSKVKAAFVRFKLRKAKGFHFLSKKEENVASRMGFNFKYKIVLPNGVDSNIFHPDDTKHTQKVRFMFLPSIECKGVKVVIEAWKRIKDKSNMELHIAGGGELSDYVKQEAEKEGFTYHGVLPLSELAELYRSCDVFVYPTACDTFGLVVIEALSSGLYVLSSEYFKGIFDDFEKLHYLEYLPRDPEAFARRMEEVAKDEAILSRDRMKQYQYSRDNYSWEKISKRLYDFFFEIAEKEGKL